MTPETEKLEDAIATLEHDLQHCDGSTYTNLPVRHVVTCTQAARRYAEVLPLLEDIIESDLGYQALPYQKELAAIVARDEERKQSDE